LRRAECRASFQQHSYLVAGVAGTGAGALDVSARNRAIEAGEWNTGFYPAQAVNQAELARVANGTLIEFNFCARDDERSVDRGVGVGVGIVDLELIESHGRILVSAWICKLGANVARRVKKG